MDDETNNNTLRRAVTQGIAAAGAHILESRRKDGGELKKTRTEPLSIDENFKPETFGGKFQSIALNNPGLDTAAAVSEDGRVNININQRSRALSNLLAPALRDQLAVLTEAPTPPDPESVPKLNIVIQVVGSRGDVQPFIALGKALQQQYGHRIRLATHPTFQGFVEESGLEFFSISGDPSELMAFMVKNPGLMPGIDALKNGDVAKRRKGMYEIMKGCWRSCIETGDGLGVAASDATIDEFPASVEEASGARPFMADAIIANPPSFAHIHCAEKLGIPVHVMFTMPWSPTGAFPHPLANIQSSNADSNVTNYLSYTLVEMMTWQGLGDLVNRFRENTLDLEPLHLIWAPGMLNRLRIPHTYCWSPALIPKPRDWGNHIDISGFFFLPLASSYTPDPELQAFLDAGPPPVYIGFGSIVVDDPTALTELIFKAVQLAGVRALVSKGWGGLGGDSAPDGIFMLGNCPHDWLFQRVSCVVHHGGAGTTAAGIALGRPTVIVPFFGDQPFWGAMVAKAGAGPQPIPHKKLTAENLAAAISEALKPSSTERAKELSAKIAAEKGSDVGAMSFQRQLPLSDMRCSLSPSRIAVWRHKKTGIHISAVAATALANEGQLDFTDLRLYRPKEYIVDEGAPEPLTGGASALLGTTSSILFSLGDIPREAYKYISGKEKSKEKSKEKEHEKEPEKEILSETASTASTEPMSVFDSRSSLDSSLTVQTDEVKTIQKSASSEIATPERSRSSLAQTLRKHSSSHSISRPCSPKVEDFTVGTAIATGKGLSRVVGTALRSPMDFTLALAQGFHNAPKLYGDDTVRPTRKVTGIQSGLRTAGEEFGFGFYDGITGLVTQPLRGAQQEGAAGLMKGVAKGAFGLILKPGAAIWGLQGYAFKGIYKEVQKLYGSSVNGYIIAARTAQGYEDFKLLGADEKRLILDRWHEVVGKVKKNEKERSKSSHGRQLDGDEPKWPSFAETIHMSWEERKALAQEKKNWKEEHKKGSRVHEQPSVEEAPTPASSSSTGLLAGSDEQYEEAIMRSVTQTSRGNPAEDAAIERALRASVRELRTGTGTQDEAVEKAILASVREAEQDGYDEATREAIKQSLLDSYARASAGHTDEYEQELADAILKSQEAQTEQLSREEQARREEEIVLEYVKRQSLAEQAYREGKDK